MQKFLVLGVVVLFASLAFGSRCQAENFGVVAVQNTFEHFIKTELSGDVQEKVLKLAVTLEKSWTDVSKTPEFQKASALFLAKKYDEAATLRAELRKPALTTFHKDALKILGEADYKKFNDTLTANKIWVNYTLQK